MNFCYLVSDEDDSFKNDQLLLINDRRRYIHLIKLTTNCDTAVKFDTNEIFMGNNNGRANDRLENLFLIKNAVNKRYRVTVRPFRPVLDWWWWDGLTDGTLQVAAEFTAGTSAAFEKRYSRYLTDYWNWLLAVLPITGTTGGPNLKLIYCSLRESGFGLLFS